MNHDRPVHDAYPIMVRRIEEAKATGNAWPPIVSENYNALSEIEELRRELIRAGDIQEIYHRIASLEAVVTVNVDAVKAVDALASALAGVFHSLKGSP